MQRSMLILSVLAVLIALTSVTNATEIGPGPVTGHWYATGNPYNVNGEIYVPSNNSLYIHEGVQVIFQGHYKFKVNPNAILQADGTEQDSITFTATNTTTGWWGIRFDSANYLSYLHYCSIRYGIANALGEDGKGGGIYINNCSPVINHCSIEYCNARTNGGGIYYVSSTVTPVIQNSKLHCNSTGGYGTNQQRGGGLDLYSNALDAIIEYCIFDSCSIINTNGFDHNSVYGGGFACKANSIIINNCVFAYNKIQAVTNNCRGGGLYLTDTFAADFKNNILYNNGIIQTQSTYTANGGGIYINNTLNLNLTAKNNTLFNNYCSSQVSSSGGGLFVAGSTTGINISNSIYWANSPNQIGQSGLTINYCDIQGGYTGTGNINADPLFVPGPDGFFYLSQFNSGQTQQSPCVNTGDPAAPMIIGTTRTDGFQDQGVIDMGYHYNYGGPVPSTVTVNLDPVNPPIVVPAGGGSFDYNLTLQNNTTSPQTFDFWCTVQVPGGAQFTALGPVMNLSLATGQWVTRLRTQVVPANAPSGYYIYWGFVGAYPWTVTHYDYFTFIKEGAESDWLGTAGWLNYGDPLPGEVGGTRSVASASGSGPEGGLRSTTPTTKISPNPFNPSTVASFELRVPSHVSLRVYDTTGRLVTTLVNGWREAGEHHVTFDGSGLPSGVYVYRLETGEQVAGGKMVLLK